MKVRGHLVRLVVVALVPAALLAAGFLVQLIRQERAAAESAQQNVARALAQGVDTEVRRTITALEILATADALAHDDLPAFRERAEAVRRVHGRWSNVVLLDPQGKVLIDLRVPPGAPMPQPFEGDAAVTTLRDRRPQISDVVPGPATGRPGVFVAVPVVRGNVPRYALAATMDYDQWTDLLARQLPAGWIAAIDDRAGVVFARSERPEAFAGKPAAEPIRVAYTAHPEGVVRVANREGLDVQVAFNRSDLTGWHTLVVVPRALLTADADRLLWVLGVGTVLVFGFAVLVALAFARPLATGSRKVKDAVTALATQQAAEPAATGIDELDEAGRRVQEVANTLAVRRAQVDELSAQLAERAEAAERANRMKDEFLGMLGHELRNPLSAIGNATAVLLMQLTGDPKRMAEIIGRQTGHLTALVDDLLDVSRAVAGKMHLACRDLDLAQVVTQVWEALREAPAFADHDVRFDLAPAPVHADPHRALQLVRNLLENALKYTPPDGPIRVRTHSAAGHAVLEVEDTGQGIDPALLPRIFEPFVQAPQSIARRGGGLGLGLAIAQQIAEKHGGRIAASSAGIGKGARFVVELPLAGVPPVPGERAVAHAPHAQVPLRIALVEDHEDARASLATMLREDGHRVHEAGDGLLGLVLLQENAFDAAFVDIGLPGASGYDVVRRARAAGVRCRLVALTGYGQAADRERALAAGFDDFLVKPATLEEIRRLLAGVERVAPPE